MSLTETLRRVNATQFADKPYHRIKQPPAAEPSEASEASEPSEPEVEAPAPEHDSAHKLVDVITDHVLAELEQLAGQISELIAEAKARRDIISAAIRTHQQFADAVVAHKAIIVDAMAKVRAEFDASRQAALPPDENGR